MNTYLIDYYDYSILLIFCAGKNMLSCLLLHRHFHHLHPDMAWNCSRNNNRLSFCCWCCCYKWFQSCSVVPFPFYGFYIVWLELHHIHRLHNKHSEANTFTQVFLHRIGHYSYFFLGFDSSCYLYWKHTKFPWIFIMRWRYFLQGGCVFVVFYCGKIYRDERSIADMVSISIFQWISCCFLLVCLHSQDITHHCITNCTKHLWIFNEE